jgi:prepilin-type N-terminal cleavage/methylation domain-containing protein
MYKLKKKLEAMLETRKKMNQDGFTLLELLVVVAILAAIAGTATIALKDTDARASAAAHVAMMDELNKGIRTYRVIKRNELPSRFDSLMVSPAAYAAGTAAGGTGPLAALGFDVGTAGTMAGEPAVSLPIVADIQAIMFAGGIEQLQYIDETAAPEGTVAGSLDCANGNIQALIGARSNAVVAGNIFMSATANGCGTTVDMYDGGAATPDLHTGVFWVGGSERLTGQEDVTPFDGDNATTAEGPLYLLTGVGPSSSLFNANELGGMTTVPVYRHVKPDEYNRFIAAWNVGSYDGAGTLVPGDQAELVAILDGALDTKEEELGEWDGTRNTI